MSFGFSIGDVVAVITLAWNVYKSCRDAPESFGNISSEVLSFHAVLKEVKETVAESNLSTAQTARLGTITQGCEKVLQDLQDLVDRYESFGSKSKWSWDRMKLGTEDIAELRTRLVSNNGLLVSFISTTQLNVEKRLRKYVKECQEGKHEGSIVSAQSKESLSLDDKTIWRSIRKELEDIGISVAAFDANKKFIMEYFRTAVEEGSFEEQPAAPENVAPVAVKDPMLRQQPQKYQDRWLSSTTLSMDIKSDIPEVNFSTMSLTSTSGTNDSSGASPIRAIRTVQPNSARVRQPLITENQQLSQVDKSHKRLPSLVNWIFKYEASFLTACESGDTEKARKLLAKGVSVEARTLAVKPSLSPSGNRLTGYQDHDYLQFSGLNLRSRHYDDYPESPGSNVPSKHYGDTALFLAAKNGHFSIVQMLIEHGVAIDARNYLGDTALHATMTPPGALPVTKCLLENGANVNKANRDKETALHLAVNLGLVAAVDLLVKYGADSNLLHRDGSSPLGLAICANQETVVRILLKNGGDPNLVLQKKTSKPINARKTSSAYEYISRGKSAKEPNKSYSPLHLAIGIGSLPITELLLSFGADDTAQSATNNSPLIHAIYKGLVDIVEALLKSGVDPNAAVGTARKEPVKSGLRAVLRWDPPYLPLHEAIMNCHEATRPQIVKMLLENGANPNVLTVSGMTALHIAITKRSNEIVKLLLDHGADVEVQIGDSCGPSKSGLTPLQLAFAPADPINRIVDYVDCQPENTDSSLLKVTGDDIIRTLLQYGANAMFNTRGEKYSIFWNTISTGNIKIFKALLRHGVPVGRQALFHLWNTRTAPIYGSCIESRCNPHLVKNAPTESEYRVSIANVLVEYGADIHATNKFNQTILHIAAQKGCVSMVEYALEMGVDVNVADVQGVYAGQYARSSRMINIFVATEPVRKAGGLANTPLPQESKAGSQRTRNL